MQARFEPFGVELPDDDDVARIAAEHLARTRERATSGRSVAGDAFGTYKAGPRKGAPITLRQTGDLLDGLTVTREPHRAHLTPTARHAPFVLERFPLLLQIDPDQAAAAFAEAFDRKQRS